MNSVLKTLLKNRDHRFLATASGLWLLAILLVGPAGDFPLNDDWTYARTVQHLLATGRYDPGDWPAMTLWGHVLWGAAFCKVFGFSFWTLRLSMLVLAWIGALLFYRLSSELTGQRWWPRMAFFTLVFSPFFFSLSLTFMTEISFLALTLGALYYYRRALLNGGLRDWALATFLATVSVLIRQLGLLLPVAFGLVLVLQKRDRRSIGPALAGILLCTGVWQLFVYWLAQNPGLPASFGRLTDLWPRLQPSVIIPELRRYACVFLFYAAILLLPLLLLLPYRSGSPRFRVTTWIVATGAALLCALWYWEAVPIENLWYDLGLGPVTLSSAYRGYWTAFQGPAWIWDGIRLLGFGGVALLLYQGIDGLRRITAQGSGWTGQQWWKAGLVFYLLSYYGFLMVNEIRFDRYFLQLQPVWILLLTRRDLYQPPAWRWAAAGGPLLLLGAFTVAATYDYFAWNRVRWEMLRNLQTEQGVPPSRIDGGFEFNGWYATAPRNPMGTNSKSWYFVAEDEYVLDFNHYDDCYSVTAARSVPTLFPGKDSLLLLRRPRYDRIDTIRCDVEHSLPPGDLPAAYTFLAGGVIDTTVARNGQPSLLLTPDQPYGLTLRLAPAACEQLTVSIWQHTAGPAADVVVSAPDPEQFYARPGGLTDQREGDWRRTRYELRLPPAPPADTLLVYVWNDAVDSVWVDGMEVVRCW